MTNPQQPGSPEQNSYSNPDTDSFVAAEPVAEQMAVSGAYGNPDAPFVPGQTYASADAPYVAPADNTQSYAAPASHHAPAVSAPESSKVLIENRGILVSENGEVIPRKIPELAMVLSFICPGLGSLVNGDIAEGAMAFACAVFCTWLLFFGVGLVVLPVVVAYSMYAAFKGAQAYNRSVGYLE